MRCLAERVGPADSQRDPCSSTDFEEIGIDSFQHVVELVEHTLVRLLSSNVIRGGHRVQAFPSSARRS